MPGAEILSDEAKHAPAGFRVAELAEAGLVIETWGYFTPEVAVAFEREVPEIVQKLGTTGAFMLDATQLKPQATEGQDAFRVLFRGLSTRSFGKATLKTGNVLTRMQLARLVRECGLDARIAFE